MVGPAAPGPTKASRLCDPMTVQKSLSRDFGFPQLRNVYRRPVNEANRVITEYVESYRYCFSEREYLEQNPEERLRRRFMADPLLRKG